VVTARGFPPAEKRQGPFSKDGGGTAKPNERLPQVGRNSEGRHNSARGRAMVVRRSLVAGGADL
jgi:hypothetical protein